MKEEAMTQMEAVVGYLPDDVAKGLGSGGHNKGPIEVRLDRGSEELLVKVDPKDVAGVLLGASRNGETGVQLLLRENAKVDTVARGTASDFLRPIKDFNFIRWRLPLISIYISPQNVEKLEQLNRAQIR